MDVEEARIEQQLPSSEPSTEDTKLRYSFSAHYQCECTYRALHRSYSEAAQLTQPGDSP